jgi:hypothetical protein
MIDLIDDSRGIDDRTFESLASFALSEYPELCDDVISAVEGGQGRVYLNEDTADDLRAVQPPVEVDFLMKTIVNKLTLEQIANWRKMLFHVVGSYALIAPADDIQKMRDKFHEKQTAQNRQG